MDLNSFIINSQFMCLYKISDIKRLVKDHSFSLSTLGVKKPDTESFQISGLVAVLTELCLPPHPREG
jgi:hypothetical protein